MEDISGFGLRIQLIASLTFPVGVTLTQFADDADPFDIPAIQVADKAMGLNGDLVVWATAKPIDITINLIPNTVDDENLGILLENNRVAKGKFNLPDIITLIGLYPDGSSISLQQGRITNGMPGLSVASAGRLKTRPYTFTFENRVIAG